MDTPRSQRRAGAPALTLVALAACGGRGPVDERSLAEWACDHVTEGELVDVADRRLDAVEIEANRAPYRVNVIPEEPGYLAFTIAEGRATRVVTDDAEAIRAIWSFGARIALEVVERTPTCAEAPLYEADLGGLEAADTGDPDAGEPDTTELLAGEHVLEVGPTRQANVWLAVGRP